LRWTAVKKGVKGAAAGRLQWSAESFPTAVAEGRFRPEDLAKYGWNQALRTFGVKPRKPATAEEVDASEGAVKAEVEATAPAPHPDAVHAPEKKSVPAHAHAAQRRTGPALHQAVAAISSARRSRWLRHC
jgi:hypothetical protein